MTRDPFDDYEREARLERDFEREHPISFRSRYMRRDEIVRSLPPVPAREDLVERIKQLEFPFGADPLEILRKAGLL